MGQDDVFRKIGEPHAAQKELVAQGFPADGKLLFINEHGRGGIPLEDSLLGPGAQQVRRLRIGIRDFQVHTVVRAARQIGFPVARGKHIIGRADEVFQAAGFCRIAQGAQRGDFCHGDHLSGFGGKPFDFNKQILPGMRGKPPPGGDNIWFTAVRIEGRFFSNYRKERFVCQNDRKKRRDAALHPPAAAGWTLSWG